jgi:hypothetical protein
VDDDNVDTRVGVHAKVVVVVKQQNIMAAMLLIMTTNDEDKQEKRRVQFGGGMFSAICIYIYIYLSLLKRKLHTIKVLDNSNLSLLFSLCVCASKRRLLDDTSNIFRLMPLLYSLPIFVRTFDLRTTTNLAF